MSKPLDLETSLAEFSGDDKGWTVIDAVTSARLDVPDDHYPGTDVVRLFLSRSDSEAHIREVIAASPNLRNAVLVSVAVPLIRTVRGIAPARAAGQKVGFVVHTPNEVYEAYEG